MGGRPRWVVRQEKRAARLDRIAQVDNPTRHRLETAEREDWRAGNRGHFDTDRYSADEDELRNVQDIRDARRRSERESRAAVFVREEQPSGLVLWGFWLTVFNFIVLSPLALFLSIKGLRRINLTGKGYKGKPWAISAIIWSSIMTVVLALFVYLYLGFWARERRGL